MTVCKRSPPTTVPIRDHWRRWHGLVLLLAHTQRVDHTAQHARSLVDMLARHNVPHDIKFYDNVAHSFANQGRNFAPTAAEDAWQRTLAFFEQHVRQAGEATRL